MAAYPILQLWFHVAHEIDVAKIGFQKDQHSEVENTHVNTWVIIREIYKEGWGKGWIKLYSSSKVQKMLSSTALRKCISLGRWICHNFSLGAGGTYIEVREVTVFYFALQQSALSESDQSDPYPGSSFAWVQALQHILTAFFCNK